MAHDDGADGLRLATAADQAAVLGIMEQFYAEEGYPWDAAAAGRALAGLLTAPDWGAVLVIERAGDIEAYAVLTFGYSLEYHGRLGLLDELFVAPALRGQGLGQRLIQAAALRCRDAGLATLHLEVEGRNARARALYERLGFRDAGRSFLTWWL